MKTCEKEKECRDGEKQSNIDRARSVARPDAARFANHQNSMRSIGGYSMGERSKRNAKSKGSSKGRKPHKVANKIIPTDHISDFFIYITFKPS